MCKHLNSGRFHIFKSPDFWVLLKIELGDTGATVRPGNSQLQVLPPSGGVCTLLLTTVYTCFTYLLVLPAYQIDDASCRAPDFSSTGHLYFLPLTAFPSPKHFSHVFPTVFKWNLRGRASPGC